MGRILVSFLLATREGGSMQTDVSAEWDDHFGCVLPAAKPSGLGKVGVVAVGECVGGTSLKYYVQLHT